MATPRKVKQVLGDVANIRTPATSTRSKKAVPGDQHIGTSLAKFVVPKLKLGIRSSQPPRNTAPAKPLQRQPACATSTHQTPTADTPLAQKQQGAGVPDTAKQQLKSPEPQGGTKQPASLRPPSCAQASASRRQARRPAKAECTPGCPAKGSEVDSSPCAGPPATAAKQAKTPGQAARQPPLSRRATPLRSSKAAVPSATSYASPELGCPSGPASAALQAMQPEADSPSTLQLSLPAEGSTATAVTDELRAASKQSDVVTTAGTSTADSIPVDGSMAATRAAALSPMRSPNSDASRHAMRSMHSPEYRPEEDGLSMRMAGLELACQTAIGKRRTRGVAAASTLERFGEWYKGDDHELDETLLEYNEGQVSPTTSSRAVGSQTRNRRKSAFPSFAPAHGFLTTTNTSAAGRGAGEAASGKAAKQRRSTIAQDQGAREEVAALARELMQDADRLLPDEAPDKKRRRPRAGKEGSSQEGSQPLRERLQQAWQGKSYYERLRDMANEGRAIGHEVAEPLTSSGLPRMRAKAPHCPRPKPTEGHKPRTTNGGLAPAATSTSSCGVVPSFSGTAIPVAIGSAAAVEVTTGQHTTSRQDVSQQCPATASQAPLEINRPPHDRVRKRAAQPAPLSSGACDKSGTQKGPVRSAGAAEPARPGHPRAALKQGVSLLQPLTAADASAAADLVAPGSTADRTVQPALLEQREQQANVHDAQIDSLGPSKLPRVTSAANTAHDMASLAEQLAEEQADNASLRAELASCRSDLDATLQQSAAAAAQQAQQMQASQGELQQIRSMLVQQQTLAEARIHEAETAMADALAANANLERTVEGLRGQLAEAEAQLTTRAEERQLAHQATRALAAQQSKHLTDAEKAVTTLLRAAATVSKQLDLAKSCSAGLAGRKPSVSGGSSDMRSRQGAPGS